MSSTKQYTLELSDGTVTVDYDVIKHCHTIKDMIEDIGETVESIPCNETNVHDISKIIEYITYRLTDTKSKSEGDSSFYTNYCDTTNKSIEELHVLYNEMASLINSVNKMNVKIDRGVPDDAESKEETEKNDFLDFLATKIKDILEDKSIDDMRTIMSKINDFEADEYEAISQNVNEILEYAS